MLTLNTLPKSRGKKKKRLGRGNASRGNYSGRGMKGQRARSGGKGGLKLRGLKQSMLAVPKSRGFSSLKPRNQIVTLGQLDKNFDAEAVVGPQELFAKQLIGSLKSPVKILGSGQLTKKLVVRVHAASQSAVDAILNAGGAFEAIALRKPRQKKSERQQTKTVGQNT